MPGVTTNIDTIAAPLAPIAPMPGPDPIIIHQSGPPAPEMLVPIVFFIVVFGAVVLYMYYRYRTRRLIQEERMRAMELHIPIPPEPQRARGNPYILPMLLMGPGLALLVLWRNLASTGDDDSVVALAFGMIALLAGLGWLLAIRLNRDERQRLERLAEMETQAYVAALERSGRAPQPPEPPAPPVA